MRLKIVKTEIEIWKSQKKKISNRKNSTTQPKTYQKLSTGKQILPK